MDAKWVHWALWQKVMLPCMEGGLDIRRLMDVVEGFSLKLWWRFKTCTSFWSKFMKAKYCANRIPILVQPKFHDSQAWKRMLSGYNIAEKNIRWRIEKGKLLERWQWKGDIQIANMLGLKFQHEHFAVPKVYAQILPAGQVVNWAQIRESLKNSSSEVDTGNQFGHKCIGVMLHNKFKD
ncbi:Uncharacterized protein TCM_044629 [Theobroma cacao]|uniref:Reverse transcriptase zinc-binding domain-containing protein n=1 Tax=Theobroma cacao TaxID=3641 RepID=A0A061FXF9_THECC|nr:Uncharacterized protein TCM_044629 [Theobroma cacao]